jgi:hypothetical protein
MYRATTYWIPASNVKFMSLAQRIILFVSQNEVRLGMIESTVLGKWYKVTILEPYGPLQSAYTDYADPATRTPVIIKHFQRLRKDFEPRLRELARVLKGFPADIVTEEDLVQLGLPPRADGPRKPAPVAVQPPGILFEVAPQNTVHVKFFNRETGKRGKPAGQHGVEACWAIRPTASEPVHYDDLTRSSFDTSSPFVLQLSDHDRGKFIYMAFRWENTRGDKGPFTEIYQVMVP